MSGDAVLLEVIGGAFAVVVTGISVAGTIYAAKTRTKIQHLKSELNVRSQVLSMSRWVGHWKQIDAEIKDIVEKTEISRVFLIVAWNGKYAPEWVTVTHQYMAANEPTVAYIEAEIDEHYQEMLRDLERKNCLSIITKELPDNTLLKNIYTQEDVTQAEILFIGAIDHPGDSRELDYASFATKRGEKISPGTRLRCNLLISRIRALIMIPQKVIH